MRQTLIVIAVLLLVGASFGGELKKGDHETAFRLSYSDTSFGTSEGFDLGSTKDTEFALSYGWLLTDHHEFGFVASYSKQEIDGGDIQANSSTDGTGLGGFYIFNFSSQGSLIPYAGVALSTLSGDLGDAYNFQYSVEAGVKVYPFDHGGVTAGLSYFKLQADAAGLPDADGVSFRVGLLFKY